MTPKTIKPGWKSTEFLLALLVAVLSILAGQYSDTQLGEVAGIVSAALVAAGYGFVRSGVKRVEAAGVVAAAERADVLAMQRAQGRATK